MTKQTNSKQSGFAGMEVLLVVVVVAALVGMGVWVAKQRSDKNSATSQSSVQAVDPSKTGTAEGLDQVMQADSQSEESIDQKNETSEQSDATSSNTAQKNIGGAYDESSL